MLALLASVGETVQQTGAVVAVPGGDEAAAASLRCLDPSHGDVCTRCVPARLAPDAAAHVHAAAAVSPAPAPGCAARGLGVGRWGRWPWSPSRVGPKPLSTQPRAAGRGPGGRLVARCCATASPGTRAVPHSLLGAPRRAALQLRDSAWGPARYLDVPCPDTARLPAQVLPRARAW